MARRRMLRLLGFAALGAVLVVLVAGPWARGGDGPPVMSLDALVTAAAHGRVAAVEFDADGSLARAGLVAPTGDEVRALRRSIAMDEAATAAQLRRGAGGELIVEVPVPIGYARDLTSQLITDRVRVTAEPEDSNLLGGLLETALPVVLVLGGMWWFLRGTTGASRQPGGHRGKALRTPPAVRFADIGGADEAIADLREAVDLLRDPARFAHLGVRVPRGYLLEGPPGTGKTLLAEAVAGEAGVPFIPVSGSEFVEMYAGVGAARVRSLFTTARRLIRRGAPGVVIFIDEVDAVGRARAAHGHPASSETENTLNQLLTEVDGFTKAPILLLLATNRADLLDKALTRPGRVDRTVPVGLPDRAARRTILGIHLKGKPLAADVDDEALVSLSRRCAGMSGADLAQLVNEAAMIAARRGLAALDTECLHEALATANLGRERTSAVVTDFDRTVTAWHEAGHAIAAYLIPEAPTPVRVTIVPRGPAGGVTWMQDGDEVFLRRSQALAQLTVALAGRAAEERLLDGDYTSGPHGDLASATRLATAMVTEYGMGVGRRPPLARRPADAGASDDTLAQVDRLLREALGRAAALLAANAPFLEAVARRLLEEETLGLDDLADLAGSVPPGLVPTGLVPPGPAPTGLVPTGPVPRRAMLPSQSRTSPSAGAPRTPDEDVAATGGGRRHRGAARVGGTTAPGRRDGGAQD